MIVTARGVLAGADLSGSVERNNFSVEATFGARMDILKMQLNDPTLALAFPDRSEIVIYDAPDYQSAAFVLNPAAYYRLSDINSTAVDDAHANNGTVVGGVTQSVVGAIVGDSDTAMTFNGSTGKITLPSFTVTPPYSVGIWINTSLTAQRPAFSSRGAAGLYLGSEGAGHPFAFYNNATVPGLTGTGQVNDGQWHLLSATLTSTAIFLYLDGVLVGTNTTTVSATASTVCSIGWDSPNNEWWNGGLDECILVGTNLSAAQWLLLYRVGVKRILANTAPVIDPPFAVSTYNTFLNGAGNEKTSTNPALWTPRIFAGYSATPVYSMESTERQIQVQAQDYTYRLRSTVINQAYAAGNTDGFIVKNIFAKYRPDFDTTNVVTTCTMPAISFPVHSLEQFMQRVHKVSQAVYRVDYYKQLFYGAIGQVAAPLSLSDTPDGISSFGYENAQYSPDVSSLSDKVWVVGSTFLSATQTYIIPAALVNGSNYQFPLPGAATKGDIIQVLVGGVGKTIGQTPGDGDITDQSTFKNDCLIQTNPATISFKVTPPNATAITVKGQFRYPLIQSYADPVLVAAAGGLLFEAVVRDKRISDLALAQQVAKTYLKNQGLTLKGLTLTSMQRGLNNRLLQPGQTIQVTGTRLFTGLGGPTLTFLITRTNLVLDTENDLDHPYRMELEMVDHAVSGGY